MMTTPKTLLKASDLQIGDIVRTSPDVPGPYRDATVFQIKDGRVHLVRPYIHTADFIYTGGVITYVGQEEYTIDGDADVELLERRPPEETREKLAAIKNDLRAAIERGSKSDALRALRLLQQL